MINTVTRRALAATLCVASVLGWAPSAGATPHHADVLTFADQSVVGASSLGRNERGINASVATSGLTPGDVVTVWIVVFNNPGACTSSPCSADDRFVDEVDAHAVYGGGHVIGGSGRAGYGLHLAVGDDSREDLWGDGPALTDPFGAEVHLVLRTHGQKQPGNVDDQIHTANEGCNPACTNVQYSVHQP